MEEIHTSIKKLLSFIEQPLGSHDALPKDDEALAAEDIQSFLGGLAEADKNTLNATITALLPGFDVPDDYQAGRLAQIIGTLVERGGDPSIAIEALLDRMEEMLELVYSKDLDEIPDDWQDHSDELELEVYKALRGLHPMTLAAMAMLSRDTALVKAAQQRSELIEAIDDAEEVQGTLWYLKGLLTSAFDQKVLVLYPEKSTGWEVELNAVRNNYHLISLLEGALVEGGFIEGPEPDRDVLALARGETFTVKGDRPGATWHYYSWPAFSDKREPDMTRWTVWGEMSPRQILKLNDTPVMIMTPLPMKSRTWDPQFIFSLHPILRPSVKILRALGKEEFDDWMETIKTAEY